MHSPVAAASRYMPQLDSLRAIAVIGVMLHHFWPEGEVLIGLTTGFLGVQLFFVLSGFLITGILLRARDVVSAGLQSTNTEIRRFYIRRFLRIFPLFYGMLAVTWIVGLPEVRDSLPWHLAYATNVYFVHIEDWHGSVSHLWSLAVEEQFYLVWPFAIVLMPRRVLLPLLVGVVALAPAFRLFGAWVGWHWMVWFVLPFANCDALGLGALLAFASTDGFGNNRMRSSLVRAGFWVGLPFVLALWFLEFNQLSWPVTSWFRTGFENTVWGLFFMWLIAGAARGFGGTVGRVFQLAPLTYLGKISYGLYVIHPFMARVVPWAYEQLGAGYPTTSLVEFPVLAAATILVAAASWQLYERPLNDLKRYFSYA
jgi:peptidoglycan/LPS O-acetylase OafA/YrhL